MCRNIACIPFLKPHLSVLQQSATTAWAFDFTSFAIGFVTALLLVALGYRYRGKISQYRTRIKEQAQRFRERLTANMATRYCESAAQVAQTLHLFGALVPLEKVYVGPKLATLTPATDADVSTTLLPLQAVQAHHRLALIGTPGSGRTTLLSHLWLHLSNQVLTSGEGNRVPMYIYLPAIATELAGQAADASESGHEKAVQQLVQNALGSMSGVVATGVVRWLRRQVEGGKALVMLDGWDEIPAAQRSAVTHWIQELIAASPDNHLLVAAGERGYAPLLAVGFVPVRCVPWTHQQLSDLSKRWRAAWPRQAGEPEETSPTISYTLNPPTPLEASIDLVIQLLGHPTARTPSDRMSHVIDLLLPQPERTNKGEPAWPLESGQRALEHLAHTALTQYQAVLGREEIQAAVTQAMPPLQFAVGDLQDEPSTLNAKAAREEQEQRTLQIVDCCRALTALGAPIRSWDSQTYYFAHPLITAYLAARHAANNKTDVSNREHDPSWSGFLRYYVGLAPAAPVVASVLNGPDDLFFNRLWRAGSLLAAAPADNAPWRIGLIKRLAQLFLNPRVPARFREQALVALVDSGDPGIERLFNQAAGHADPSVRAGAILGMGASGSKDYLSVIETALGDNDEQVRLAAVNAASVLARRGIESALDLIITSIIEAQDGVQRVAAELLADLGPEGHAVLRDGAADHDLIVRRASVYGLSTINETWARQLLHKVQREDDEWLVRNAAAEALAGLDDQADRTLELELPRAEAEPWLVAWAAEQGLGTGTGEAAQATLVRALAEGEPVIRYSAIEALRRIADPHTIDCLRLTLRDPDPELRDLALAALNEISQRYDMTITAN